MNEKSGVTHIQDVAGNTGPGKARDLSVVSIIH